MNTKKINSCPHCGSKKGFYIESDYLAVRYCIGFDGVEQDNSEMFNNSRVRERRYAYCINCEARLGNADRIYNQARGEKDKFLRMK